MSELRVRVIPYMTVAVERYATSAGASGFRAVAEVTPGELPPISVVEPTREGVAATALREHPAFDHCFRIYRNAVIDWHASGAIQNAARTLGMNARAYADARLTANQFSWASSNTVGPFTREHANLAYKLAVEEVCGVEAV